MALCEHSGWRPGPNFGDKPATGVQEERQVGQSENAQGLSAPVKMPATSSESEAERLEEEQSYVLRVVHSPTGVAH